MKIKLETSPWQEGYKTKNEYDAPIKESLCTELDIDKIEDKSSKRYVITFCLISLWDKFKQILNMTQTK